MSNTDPFAFPNPNYDQPRGNRFGDMLRDPNMQAHARQIAANVGAGAMQGALENAGLVKENGKVRKWGMVKTVVRPTHTARKAVQGAVHGARDSAVGQAREAAASVWQPTNNTSQQFPESAPVQNASNGQPADPWGSAPAEHTFSSFPAPNQVSSPWDTKPTHHDPFGPMGSSNHSGSFPSPAQNQAPGFPDAGWPLSPPPQRPENPWGP